MEPAPMHQLQHLPGWQLNQKRRDTNQKNRFAGAGFVNSPLDPDRSALVVSAQLNSAPLACL